MAIDVLNAQSVIDSIQKLADADKVGFNNAIFKDYQKTSPVTDYVSIDTGVISGDPITYVDEGKNWDYMKNATGLTCEYQPCSLGVVVTNGAWELGRYSCELTYCYDEIDATIKHFLNSYTYLENDNRNTVYSKYMLDLIGKNIVNSHWVKAWFADSASADDALNSHDGLFVRAIAAAPTSNTSARVEIAKNNGATYVDQELADDEALAIFMEMDEKAEDNFLLRGKNTPILTTYALAKNYLNTLRKKELDCCERDSINSAYQINRLNIFGRPIIVVQEWDEILNGMAEFNDGTSIVSPHRALIAEKSNLRFATGEAGRLNRADVLYDPISEKTYVRSKYEVGTKIMEESAFVLAI